MAKRKTAKARTTRRRRSVGAINKGVIMQAGATIAGFVAANMLQNKVLPNLDPKIKGLAFVAVGTIVLPMVVKSDIAKQIGIGMAVSGGVEALKSFGVISGTMQPVFLASNPKYLAGGGINQSVGGGGINQSVGAYGTAMQNALKYG